MKFYNLTNNTSYRCNPLLDSEELKDGGVPLVLGINTAIAVGLLVCFMILHCCFKDFVMAAVVNRKRQPLLSREPVTLEDDDEEVLARRRRGSSLSTSKDICESIIKFITTDEEGVCKRSGPDAGLYLTMELYLLAILCVYAVFSIGIILPVNYLSGDIEKGAPFARTTVGNVNAFNPSLWSHVIFSVLYVIIAGLFMLHYTLRLGKYQQTQSVHTAMIQGIPHYVHVEDLLQHFEESVQGSQIVDIRFAYDTKCLTKKWNKMKKVIKELEIAENYENERNEPLMINTGWRKICICSEDTKVQAKDYYEKELESLRVIVAMERSNSLANKLQIVFVTFTKSSSTTELLESYKICRHKPESSLSDSICSSSWSVSLAPLSMDIIWENLSIPRGVWWLRWIGINIILVVFLIFFTTPSILLDSVVQFKAAVENVTATSTPRFFQSYISSFLLIIFGWVLLFIVIKSVFLEFHWSKTKREQIILRKAFLFKVLQVIILPSIGLTSLSALGQLSSESELEDHLSCIFLPNNGAFFISYIIIATCVSIPLELLRVPQFLEYVYHKSTAKTKLQRHQAFKKVLRYDFALGIQYALNLLIFTLTTTFSLVTPLIVPFGAVFFVAKYFADKYNLLYAYRPVSSSGHQYLHKSAVRFVLIGSVNLQLATLFYSAVRADKLNPRSVVMFVMLLITCLILFGILVLNWFSYLLPKIRSKLGMNYEIFDNIEESDEIIEPGGYIAPVLSESAEEVPASNTTGQSYESFGRTIAGGQVKINSSPPPQEESINDDKQ